MFSFPRLSIKQLTPLALVILAVILNASATASVSSFSSPISPDGSKIAYIARADSSDDYEIFLINSDGSGEKQVTDNSTDESLLTQSYISESPTTWSSDGKYLLFSSGGTFGTHYRVDAEGDNLTRLTDQTLCGGWSKNDQIATFGTDKTVRIIDVNGNTIQSYSIDRGITHGSCYWSPDGSKLAVEVREDGAGSDQEISLIDLDSSSVSSLSSLGSSNLENVFFSPDSTKLVFENYSYAQIIDPDNPLEEESLVSLSALADMKVVGWSPDGSKLLFYYNSDLHTVNSVGKELTNITNSGNVYSGSAAWSPDGTKIAYLTTPGKTLNVIDLDGSNKKELASNLYDISLSDITDISWSPDSLSLLYQDQHKNYYSVEVSGSNTTNELTEISDEQPVQWTPDSKLIASGCTSDGIRIISLDRNGKVQKTLSSHAGRFISTPSSSDYEENCVSSSGKSSNEFSITKAKLVYAKGKRNPLLKVSGKCSGNGRVYIRLIGKKKSEVTLVKYFRGPVCKSKWSFKKRVSRKFIKRRNTVLSRYKTSDNSSEELSSKNKVQKVQK